MEALPKLGALGGKLAGRREPDNADAAAAVSVGTSVVFADAIAHSMRRDAAGVPPLAVRPSAGAAAVLWASEASRTAGATVPQQARSASRAARSAEGLPGLAARKQALASVLDAQHTREDADPINRRWATALSPARTTPEHQPARRMRRLAPLRLAKPASVRARKAEGAKGGRRPLTEPGSAQAGSAQAGRAHAAKEEPAAYAALFKYQCTVDGCNVEFTDTLECVQYCA